MKRIICVGTATVDLIVRGIESWPREGQRALAENASLHLGGNAINTAKALASLRVPNAEVHCAAPWGSHDLGQFICKYLDKAGVKYPFSADDRKSLKMQTPISVVMLSEDGNPRFICALHSILDFGLEHLTKCADLFETADWIHIAGLGLLPGFETEPVAAFFAKLRKKRPHLRISGDVTLLVEPGPDESAVPNGLVRVGSTAIDWPTRVQHLLKQLDYLFPNEDEAIQMIPDALTTGEAGRALLTAPWMGSFAKAVCIKRGHEGVTICEPGRTPVPIDGFLVPTVDTTGAGDSWAAGFIASMISQSEPNHVVAAEFANAVAACSVQSVGASSGIPEVPVIKAWMPTAPRT